MTILGYNFKPKIWSIIAATGFVVLFIALGNWQLSRADEKNMRQAQLDQLAKQPIVTLPSTLVSLKDFQYRQVEVRGEYQPEHTIYLDNKTYQGVAGYHVLTPVKLANSTVHVLINRGWVATGLDRAIVPEVPVIEGEVIVTGVAVSTVERTLELSDQIVKGAVWGNFHLQRYQDATGLTLQPIMVLQKDKVEDGMIRQWDRSKSGADRNLGYAFQWFSLAATTIIIFLVLNVKRKRKEIEQA